MATPLRSSGGLRSDGITLYEVPAGKTATVRVTTVVNVTGVTRTVNLYLVLSGQAARRMVSKDCQIRASKALVDTRELRLSGGDKITGTCDLTDGVDFLVSGEVD